MSAGEVLVPSTGATGDKPKLARESPKKILELYSDALSVANCADIHSKGSDSIKLISFSELREGHVQFLYPYFTSVMARQISCLSGTQSENQLAIDFRMATETAENTLLIT